MTLPIMQFAVGLIHSYVKDRQKLAYFYLSPVSAKYGFSIDRGEFLI